MKNLKAGKIKENDLARGFSRRHLANSFASARKQNDNVIWREKRRAARSGDIGERRENYQIKSNANGRRFGQVRPRMRVALLR